MSGSNQKALADDYRRRLIEYGPYYPSDKEWLASQSDAHIITLYRRLRADDQLTDTRETNHLIKIIMFLKMPYHACERKSVAFWNERSRLIRHSPNMLEVFERENARLKGKSDHAKAIKMAKYGCSPSGDKPAAPEDPEVAESHMVEADDFDRQRAWMRQANRNGCSWLAEVIAEGWLGRIERAAKITPGQMHGCGAFEELELRDTARSRIIQLGQRAFGPR